jgi:hypothetical protein
MGNRLPHGLGGRCHRGECYREAWLGVNLNRLVISHLRRDSSLARRTASQRILDQLDRCVRIIHFYDQLAVSLVMKVNHNCFLRVMHVPEDSLAVLIEGSRRDDSGHIGSTSGDESRAGLSSSLIPTSVLSCRILRQGNQYPTCPGLA